MKKARKLFFSHTFVDSDFNLNNHAVGHANKTYISALSPIDLLNVEMTRLQDIG